MSYFIGIDIGGTFTDVVLMDEKGEARIYKTESTPKDLSQCVLEGLRLAAQDLGINIGDLLKETDYLGHGTTAATNCFIERKGVKTGLITTKGFGDTILITRLMGLSAGIPKEEIPHASSRSFPSPIVPPKLIKEVTERVDFQGNLLVPLNLEEAGKAVEELVAEGVQSIAVCFLWSFKNPTNEKKMKELIHEIFPHVFVTISSELVPVMGEYERTATTVINCYLSPTVELHIGFLSDRFKEMGLTPPLLMMNSLGGVFPAEEAKKKAVNLLVSGPTGGVMGSLYIGYALGYKNIITTDMGGTSFDVGLIVDGHSQITTTSIVGKYHLLIPMVDIKTIGAGGGSIAYLEDGYLKVGPRSAGALPGPVAYNKGGEEPTVTDADVVLGIIDPYYFLGGEITLNKEKAEEAILQKIAEPLGLSLIEAASGIRKIVDNQMADLLRNVTVEKGHDPRDFALFAYGGAGPTHCASYGRELKVKAMVIPSLAAVHSAYGTVASNIRYSYQISDPMRTPPFFHKVSDYLDINRINEHFQRLEEKGTSDLRQSCIREEDIIFYRALDMRYRRQTHEIMVPVPGGVIKEEDMDCFIDLFEKKYEELYGKGASFREAGIEIITFRVEAVGKIPSPKLVYHELGSSDPSNALMGKRKVYFTEVEDFRETFIYHGPNLKAGHELKGPSIIEYLGTTVVIGPGQMGFVDKLLNIVIY